MKKIRREQFEWLKEQHYKLWDWLAEHPDKDKSEWNGFILLNHPANDCFACQFVKELSYSNDAIGCECCPLRGDNIGCLDGLFCDWVRQKDIIRCSGADKNIIEAYKESASYLAKQIRDLPWSEEYVEDEMENCMENYIVINGNKTELTKEQIKQLGIEVKTAKKERGRVEYGEDYFYVNKTNTVESNCETSDNIDEIMYRIHNYFVTKAEAEEYAEVLETEILLREFADKHNKGMLDWHDNSQLKWAMCYNYTNDKIDTASNHSFKASRVIYFTSDELIKQAINEIGEDRIKKYLKYEW